MLKKKAIFNWSGGKDSAHALWKALQSDEYDIVSLLTTTNSESGLSTMHNIPLDLLQQQSQSIGIPLKILPLKPEGNMDDYSTSITQAAQTFKAQGVTHFIFGDIFLNDIKSYRESLLKPLGIEVVEPLWHMTSQEAMDSYLDSGLKTVIVTTMADGLGESAIGHTIDHDFICSLPTSIDPNGENGEYHTFCYDGPLFSYPIYFSLGKTYSRSYDIKLENGETQTFTYCFAHLSTGK